MTQPQTFLVGATQPEIDGLIQYLEATNQTEFLDQFNEALPEHGNLCLVSFFAKLCYKSLVLGRNANVNRIRDIEQNLLGCFKSGHGSVFEHVWLNFITTNCSRVFTHELVRHRAGTAYSQTSGRYVSVEDAELVLPPEVDKQFGLPMRALLEKMKNFVADAREELDLDNQPMPVKKWWTSQLRRIMPNGQTNEIGWSCNVRSLRHMIQMRTSRHAEWEIRLVFNQVADIIKAKWPLMLWGAEEEIVDGMTEYRGLSV